MKTFTKGARLLVAATIVGAYLVMWNQPRLAFAQASPAFISIERKLRDACDDGSSAIEMRRRLEAILEELRPAASAGRLPEAHYWTALTYLQLQQSTAALNEFNAYLRDAANDTMSPFRENSEEERDMHLVRMERARRYVGTLQGESGTVRLAFDPAVPHVQIQIDDGERSTVSETLSLDPGNHHLTFSAPGFRIQSRDIALAPSSIRHLEIHMVSEAEILATQVANSDAQRQMAGTAEPRDLDDSRHGITFSIGGGFAHGWNQNYSESTWRVFMSGRLGLGYRPIPFIAIHAYALLDWSPRSEDNNIFDNYLVTSVGGTIRLFPYRPRRRVRFDPWLELGAGWIRQTRSLGNDVLARNYVPSGISFPFNIGGEFAITDASSSVGFAVGLAVTSTTWVPIEACIQNINFGVMTREDCNQSHLGSAFSQGPYFSWGMNLYASVYFHTI